MSLERTVGRPTDTTTSHNIAQTAHQSFHRYWPFFFSFHKGASSTLLFLSPLLDARRSRDSTTALRDAAAAQLLDLTSIIGTTHSTSTRNNQTNATLGFHRRHNHPVLPPKNRGFILRIGRAYICRRSAHGPPKKRTYLFFFPSFDPSPRPTHFERRNGTLPKPFSSLPRRRVRTWDA